MSAQGVSFGPRNCHYVPGILNGQSAKVPNVRTSELASLTSFFVRTTRVISCLCLAPRERTAYAKCIGYQGNEHTHQQTQTCRRRPPLSPRQNSSGFAGGTAGAARRTSLPAAARTRPTRPPCCLPSSACPRPGRALGSAAVARVLCLNLGSEIAHLFLPGRETVLSNSSAPTVWSACCSL